MSVATDGAQPAAHSGGFAVSLAQPTGDPLEVRLLTDDCDENVAITQLELYVR